jgi:hypothetical protein
MVHGGPIQSVYLCSTLDMLGTDWTKVPMLARVAELEDAVDLKSIVRKGVWVRVPPRACAAQYIGRGEGSL